MFKSVLAAIGTALVLTGAVFAGDHGDEREPRVYQSRGEVMANGERIRYRVTAGEMFLRDQDGQATGAVFSTAYIRDGVSDPTTRPIAFVFNGGPGSASLWLHMGVFGPKRVVLPSEPPGDDGAAPFDIRANPETLLDKADLVFVDPVGTGWSKPLGDTDAADTFYGVDEDAAAMAQFIRRWLSENRRWGSPKYLIGESYGTTRIGALMRQLESTWNDVSINGVVLVSVVLDFSLDHTAAGNEIGYIGLFPGYAATGWYHNQVDRSLWNNDYQAFLDDARAFATDEYLPALVRGRSLESDQRREIVSRFSAFTGLSEAYVDRLDMRVNLNHFRTELLRDQRLHVGRLDSRFTGVEPNGAASRAEDDPSGYGIDGSYTAAMLDYFTRDLGVEITEPYTTIGWIGRDWNWDAGPAGGENSYVNVSPWLERAMRQNSDLRVLAANGIYDLATPFFATEMTFNRPGYDPTRVEMTYYESGHMMYLHQPSLEQLAQDVRNFID